MIEPLNLIPAGPARTEIRVTNSRFVASAGPAASIENARAFIAAARAEMPDASHHCYAYLIGHGATTTLGMSDDGEPSGTAGRPISSVVKGSGLGDVVLVVTRYFGGTLLGTGGLVHAYSDAAKAVLALLLREPKIEHQSFEIRLDYAAYEPIKRLLEAHGGAIEAETFAADVLLRVVLPRAQIVPFGTTLRELTAGRTQLTQV